jgi:chromosome segregation ATPase
MTPSKYLFLRIASRFGYSRKPIRLNHMAVESNLLREAEILIGEAIWQKTENIEALSMEYWNLRKCMEDLDRLSKEIDHFQEKLDQIHEQRTEVWEGTNKSIQDLIAQRNQLLSQIDLLGRTRDRINTSARHMRRNYRRLKIKKNFLGKEGDKQAEIEKTTALLIEIRNEFNLLKQERQNNVQEIAAANARIKEIETAVSEHKSSSRTKISESSHLIGDANQQISSRRAQLNSIDTQIRLLYADIGSYISLNLDKNPECKNAGKEFRGMIDVMAALRKSIKYNYELS